MPKAEKPAKSAKSKPAGAKPASKSKPAAKAANTQKPVAAAKAATPPEARLPQTAAAAPLQQSASPQPVQDETQAAASKTAPPKKAPHPNKEQPMWTRFNQGHNQKMPKGRFFRHQGR